jgi:hypothetical protein
VPIVILAAGLMVLVGLGLFVGAVVTGVDALYWACVAVCMAAAVLLGLARRRISASVAGGTPAAPGRSMSAAASSTPDQAAAGASAGADEPAAVGVPAEPQDLSDPDVEDVEVTDLLLVVDLEDEVLVVDEHPRYHLAGCIHLRGRTPISLPHDEARAEGFTPCAACEPDHSLADRVRARKATKGS